MTKNRHDRQDTSAPTVSDLPTAESWAEQNAKAIAERRAWVEVNGTPLADLQVLRLD